MAFRGITANDFIYLLMPDRFANGNIANDNLPEMRQPSVQRSEPFGRHGGDLKGINDHLDYLDSLGVSALWLNPFFTNDQEKESYHGYAFTNHYEVDPRLGDLQTLRNLIESMHDRDMKFIMDVVYNHIGHRHFLAANPPSKDWFHQTDTFIRTTYRASTLLDPYAPKEEVDAFLNGAFHHTMPDFDQTNPRVAQFLIQYTLWWVKEFQMNGIRMDTYAYSDPNFIKNLVKAVYDEFYTPDNGFHIFAETWVHGHGIQQFFANDYQSTPPLYLTDFQFCFGMKRAMTTDFGWTDGLAAIYYTLAKDYSYADPFKHVTFYDNHDLDRFFGTIGEDMDKWKMATGMLMTLRGIPSILYGTELLMPEGGSHGVLRKDMPGGWADDDRNAFSRKERTETENEAYDFIANLAQLRKDDVFQGRFVQYVPVDGVYVYGWKTDDKTLVCVVNQNDKVVQLNTARFSTLFLNKSALVSPFNKDQKQAINDSMLVPGKSFNVYWAD
jgi:glycosidase